MKKKYYLITLMAGKFVMIFTISFIGHDLKALLTQPIRTVIVVLIIALLWLVGKAFENRLNAKVESDFRAVANHGDEKR